MKPYRFNNTLIIIFAREPVPGQVKTRLIPALGKEGATKLYEKLLNYILTQFSNWHLTPIQLSITPESNVDYFDSAMRSIFSDDDKPNIVFQKGADLGERMYNALSLALTAYEKAILIGTDCPFFTQDDVSQTISALDINDMVFVPANDGGYVLVAAKKLTRQCFENISWGTGQVMQQTRNALSTHGSSWQELPEKIDIDNEEDFKYIMQHDEFKELIISYNSSV